MASSQVVLLTSLESSHPQPSPSRRRINLMNIDFPVVDPLYFQTLTTCPSANPFLLSFIHFDGGVYPYGVREPRSRFARRSLDLCFPILLSPLAATFTRLPASVASKRLTSQLSSLDATFTKNQGGPGAYRLTITLDLQRLLCRGGCRGFHKISARAAR